MVEEAGYTRHSRRGQGRGMGLYSYYDLCRRGMEALFCQPRFGRN